MDSYNRWVYGNEPVSITLPAPSGGGTSFIEPDYYPDYAENEDDAPAAAPAPATPGRDESDTAPKTADAPILPTLLLAAFAALALTVSAKKRLCKSIIPPVLRRKAARSGGFFCFPQNCSCESFGYFVYCF